MRRTGRSGVILILFSGLVVLLGLVAVAVLELSRRGEAASRAVVQAESMRLAAESGVEYAAGRLLADPCPRSDASRTRDSRCDDWSYRDGPYVPLAESVNPSYSHGESWVDNEQMGVYERSPDGLAVDSNGDPIDRDGSGAFSAWSGRLRGHVASPSVVFSLRIDSAGARFPVNAGFLDPYDRNGANGPDHGDAGILLHAGVAHALNNLGMLILPAAHPRRMEITTTGEPIWCSFLGIDLIERRPQGGYRTVTDLRNALLPLGYTYWQIEAIRPFLDLSVPVAVPQLGPPVSTGLPQTGTPLPMIELLTASPDILRCLFQYLSAGSQGFCWEGGAASQPNPRTGQSYANSRWVIFPDEAFRLAHHAVAYRRSTWMGGSLQGLYQHWLSHAESMNAVYPTDFALPPPPQLPENVCRCDLIATTYPVAHRRYAQAKIDMAFAAISPDPHPFAASASSPTWSGWGLDRNPALDGIQPFQALCGWGDLRQVSLVSPFSVAGSPVAPLPLTFRSPLRFMIEAVSKPWGGVGGQAARGGVVDVSDFLFLSSQQDFECPWPDPDLQRALGIATVGDSWVGDLSTARRRGMDVDLLDGSIGTDDRTYRHIASLPAWSRDSHPTAFPPIAPTYPRYFGALTLAAREGGSRGASLYWALGETDSGVQFGAPVQTGSTLANFPSDAPSAIPWANLNPNLGSHLFTGHHLTSSAYTQLNEGGMTPDGCPGFKSGLSIQRASLEAWCDVPLTTPDNTILRVFNGGAIVSNAISVRSNRIGGAPPAVRFTVNGKWIVQDGPDDASSTEFATGVLIQGPPFTVDVPDDERTSHAHHVVVTVDQPAGSPPRLGFILDGVHRGYRSWPPQGDWPGTYLMGTSYERLTLSMADEIRLYGRVLSPAEARTNYELGRFVRSGVYRSPLYVPSGPTVLGRCRWSGIVPPAYYDADLSTDPDPAGLNFPNPARCQPRMDGGSPPRPVPAVNPIVVKVIGYADPGGASELWSEAWDVPGQERDLSAYGEVRSFRYEVRLGAMNVAGPLLDTPVFESIEIGLWQKGRRMGWVGWSAE